MGDQGPAWGVGAGGRGGESPTLLSTQAPPEAPGPETTAKWTRRPGLVLPVALFTVSQTDFSSAKLEPVIIHPGTCNFFFKEHSPEGEMSQRWRPRHALPVVSPGTRRVESGAQAEITHRLKKHL